MILAKAYEVDGVHSITDKQRALPESRNSMKFNTSVLGRGRGV
jgi:hypothetical protein